MKSKLQIKSNGNDKSNCKLFPFESIKEEQDTLKDDKSKRSVIT